MKRTLTLAIGAILSFAAAAQQTSPPSSTPSTRPGQESRDSTWETQRDRSSDRPDRDARSERQDTSSNRQDSTSSSTTTRQGSTGGTVGSSSTTRETTAGTGTVSGTQSRDTTSRTDSTRYDSTTRAQGSASLSSAEQEKVKQMARSSDSFVKAAAQAGMLEVELGKIAQQKGTTKQIRDFGQHMTRDHGKANDELKTVARQNNIVLPTALDAEHRAKLDEIKAKSGADFDAAFADCMAKDHEKAVTLFREASTANGVDDSLQAFAKKQLPTLEQHRTQAQQLAMSTSSLQRQSSTGMSGRSTTSSTTTQPGAQSSASGSGTISGQSRTTTSESTASSGENRSSTSGNVSGSASSADRGASASTSTDRSSSSSDRSNQSASTPSTSGTPSTSTPSSPSTPTTSTPPISEQESEEERQARTEPARRD